MTSILNRQSVANACLSTNAENVFEVFQSTFESFHKNSNTLDHPFINGDTEILSAILNRLQNLQENFDLGCILSGMLYLYPYQFPCLPDPEDIPEWFRQTYFRFLNHAPQFFADDEIYQNHLSFVRTWTNKLAKKIDSEDITPAWRDAAMHHGDTANMIPFYFSKENLKEIMIARAKVLDYTLRQSGFKIEYEFENKPNTKKAKIGIIGMGWDTRTETYATLPIIEHLDRSFFEVTLFVIKPNNSDIERYCFSKSDEVIILPQELHNQISTIRSCDLNILFYGTNLTAITNCVALSMHRLAPIQATSICCPSTTGMPTMDYFIAGTLTEPSADSQDFYCEKLLRIEGSGICFNYNLRQTPTNFTISRKKLGIPAKSVLFASGANFHKLAPNVRQTWCEIISSLPDSHLLLYPFGPAWSGRYNYLQLTNDLHERLDKLKVDRSRVTLLAPFSSQSDIHKVLCLADVYLDSFPYSGATSLLDPLTVSLPPITMSNQSLRFSQGAAMMIELGLSELIASDEREYIDFAIKVGKSKEYRKDLQRKIKSKFASSPPFLDGKQFGNKISDAFREMLRVQGNLET